MKTAMQKCSGPALPHVSKALLKAFAAYTRGHVSRHFHSLRILENGAPSRLRGRPLVIFLNHASWWDPLVCLLFARRFFPERTSFAPIENAMLARYGFFKRLGFFGVDRSAGGTRNFLETSRRILASPGHALWLTPQGRFVDPRERPLKLERGVGALAGLAPNAVFLPLAIEYTFWNESRPEILATFGEPIVPALGSLGGSEAWTERLASALEETQDELAAHSRQRDPAEWDLLNRGAAGTNPIYDGWHWLRARVARLKFAREHSPEAWR
jgi:1-acyl-sn-glycerol-3-phosphate acyltransferase